MGSATGTVRHPKGPPETESTRGAAPFVSALLDSSVGAKVIVALTGLGLVTFVVFHMIGNLKMFQGPDSINAYAYFLKHSTGALLWVARASPRCNTNTASSPARATHRRAPVLCLRKYA